MNKNELKELVKKHFSLVEKTEDTKTTEVNTEEVKQEAFAEATLADGTKVTNKSDAEFEVGQEIYVITESGEEVIAPSGEHTTESGITVTVDEAGKITGIARPDEGGEGSLAEDSIEEAMAEEPVAEELASEELEETQTELAEHGDEETMEISEIVETVMEAIAPKISELKEEMGSCMAKLAEYEEKMEAFSKEPASAPTESQFAKIERIKKGESESKPFNAKEAQKEMILKAFKRKTQTA